MDLNPYLLNLREDLSAAASVGDEQTRSAATLLGVAIEPAGRLAIMNALSDMAAEVTAALTTHLVEVKLDGRNVRVTVTEKSTASGSQPGGDRADYRLHADDIRRAMQDAGGELSRTTVRLFNDLKSQAENAASDQGVSLNTYISRAVSDSVRQAMPTSYPGKRSTGNGSQT